MANLPPGAIPESAMPPGAIPEGAEPEAPAAAPGLGEKIGGALVSTQGALGNVLAYPYRLAGKLDVASGLKTPEQAESRAQLYGNLTRDVAEGAMLPWSKATGLPGYLTRGAQAGLVGGAQGALEKGDPKDAALGLTLGAVLGPAAEGVAALPGAVARKTIGAADRIAREDAKRIGEAVGKIVPEFKGLDLTSAKGLNNLLDAGVDALGRAKETAVRAIERHVPQINVPTLGKGPMTLREANQELTDLGKKGWTGRGDADAQLRYRKVYDDIVTGLNNADPSGGAAAMWERAQAAFRKGLGVVGMFKPKTAYNAGSTAEDMTLNTKRIQDYLLDPASRKKLTDRLPKAEFEALADAVTRGGGAGAVDKVKNLTLSGIHNILDPRNVLLLGLPNALSQYAGRVPYAPGVAPRIGAQQIGNTLSDIVRQNQK